MLVCYCTSFWCEQAIYRVAGKELDATECAQRPEHQHHEPRQPDDMRLTTDDTR